MNLPHQHAIGMIRREFLQVGFSGLLSLSALDLMRANSLSAASNDKGRSSTGLTSIRPRVKHVILIFQTGAPSHVDTFDLKPDAPSGIRGSFNPIQTSVPGMTVTEHLPRLSRHFDKLAIVRSMSHKFNNHLNGTHEMLTGHTQPGAFFDKIASRDDYPSFASTLEYAKPRKDGIPNGVTLPTFLMEGPLVWPGQHAGFLGPKYDPWLIKSDPNRKDFKVEVNNDVLSISAEKEEESKKEDKNYRSREFSYNSFYRSFALPQNLVTDKIDAKYENGILKLVLPKMEVSVQKPLKKIKVA